MIGRKGNIKIIISSESKISDILSDIHGTVTEDSPKPPYQNESLLHVPHRNIYLHIVSQILL